MDQESSSRTAGGPGRGRSYNGSGGRRISCRLRGSPAGPGYAEPLIWSRTNWALEGTNLGAPVDYWPPQWSPSQWTGKRMDQHQSNPLSHPPRPQRPIASTYDPLVAGQDWDFLLEPLNEQHVPQPADT